MATIWAEELHKHISSVSRLSKSATDNAASVTLQAQCIELHKLRQILVDEPKELQTRSAFRHAHGFEVLLSNLDALSGSYDTSQTGDQERKDLFEVVKASCNVILAALHNHRDNQTFFKNGLKVNGWKWLEASLAGIGILSRLSKTDVNDRKIGAEQLFGCLFAGALADDDFERVFRRVCRTSEHKIAEALEGGKMFSGKLDEAIRRIVQNSFTDTIVIQHAEIVVILFNFWASLLTSWDAGNAGVSSLKTAVLLTLVQIATSSTQNGIALTACGILVPVLRQLSQPEYSQIEIGLLTSIATALLQLGTDRLDDADFIFRSATKSPRAADVLLQAIPKSRTPPHLHFDLSLHGYSSIEASNLGPRFPPHSPSNGYTIAAWVCIDWFDETSHTTIFGAFDATETCFVLMYLESDSRYLVLQTSANSVKSSVRFRSFNPERGVWYHIAIVHRRSKSSSCAALYVNGRVTEQLRCEYPADPPALNGNAQAMKELSKPLRLEPVQAFFGYPQDFTQTLGKDLRASRWSLGAAFLFRDVISADFIFVIHKLGARYCGNFQDYLGSFMTYQASAELNLQNELQRPGQDGSDIKSTLRDKASEILPETHMLLSILPNAVLKNTVNDDARGSQLTQTLTKDARDCLRKHSYYGGRDVILNAGIPSINTALSRTRGILNSSGEPTSVIPQALDDLSWRLGGCTALGLQIVNLAETQQDLLRAVELLLGLVQHNWRNSEVMERDDGFAVLASILRKKMSTNSSSTHQDRVGPSFATTDTFALDLLNLVLRFVGYAKNSLIINPLAYKALLVECDIWRGMSLPVQYLYYGQFITFAAGSKHHRFNLKRLVRMRLIQRFLDMLREEPMDTRVFAAFFEAFAVVLRRSLSNNTLRSFAMFITASLQLATSQKQFSSSSRRTNTPSDAGGPSNDEQETGDGAKVSAQEVGVKMLELYTEILCEDRSQREISRFARTVTNKWLLHLLAENDPRVVTLVMRILARLLNTSGTTYLKRFVEQTQGIDVLKMRLRNWWMLPSVWKTCLSIFWGLEFPITDEEDPFDLPILINTLGTDPSKGIACPEIWPVMAEMLKAGLLVGSQPNPAAGVASGEQVHYTAAPYSSPAESTGKPTALIRAVSSLLLELLHRSTSFRGFVTDSSFVQDVLFALAKPSSYTIEEELTSWDRTSDCNAAHPLDSSSTTVSTSQLNHSRPFPRRDRGSSFVLVSADVGSRLSTEELLVPILAPQCIVEPLSLTPNSADETLLKIILAVHTYELCTRKNFTGLGVFLKTPPGPRSKQAQFQTYFLRCILSEVAGEMHNNQTLFTDTRVLTNLAHYTLHMAEAVFEGWFLGGAEPLLDFSANLLEDLRQPSIAELKAVRLCDHAVKNIRNTFVRLILIRLSELRANGQESLSVAFLERLIVWQPLLTKNVDRRHMSLLSYNLFELLLSTHMAVRMLVTDVWRLYLVSEPLQMFFPSRSGDPWAAQNKLLNGFVKVLEVDNESFLHWVDERRIELERSILGQLRPKWEDFINQLNRSVEESASKRITKRKERLKQWLGDCVNFQEMCNRHDTATQIWNSNVTASESLKRQKWMQDQQEHQKFLQDAFQKMLYNLRRPCGFFEESGVRKSRLDQTEGRSRMRLRLLSEADDARYEYKAKQSASDLGTREPLPMTIITTSKDDRVGSINSEETDAGVVKRQPAWTDGDSDALKELPEDDDFELVAGPLNDTYDDKNRKVMRSLERGEQVQYVCNVACIVGLEACQSLAIIGKHSLYLIDNLFQRSDGEIIDPSQAPEEEVDPYLQLISGQGAASNQPRPAGVSTERRHWLWEQIASLSKRRFLFRDVALEVFFSDGRSFLLIIKTVALRNELFSLLAAQAPNITDQLMPYGGPLALRAEAAKINDETLGSRVARVFGSASTLLVTKKWMKGEMSNFDYLMAVNTLAGRTFNDLTQYPVFPWVVADYTSDELDLTNPRSFRDLTKPMGCQTPSREAEFRTRYQTFAEMGDHNAPPFHYGTHYSSAMIVTSYLIRLQPFVESYLLLQGGRFDHADRLFYSIAKAWQSASRENMSDVRELIPEFFYLPEFLRNVDKYDFGKTQASGENINDVELPPWARGDPHVFVAKHREALESAYVSENLHHWVDLVFGFKQKGEAAIEATNVFHYLSYQGAKDLDKIENPLERSATIGIIHNFGQTPHQLFQHAHPSRESSSEPTNRLDETAELLTRIKNPLLENQELVAALLYSPKPNGILCSTPLRHYVPPAYEQYLEWGFADNSIRFFTSDTQQLTGLYENLHQSQFSALLFVDEKLLITAGEDCVVQAFSVRATGKTVELQFKASLFGHRMPATCLAASRVWSTFLSADSCGRVLLWDMNAMVALRSLELGVAVDCSRISNLAGDVVFCCGQRVLLYTLNGHLLLDQNVCNSEDDRILSCAFYEGKGNEWAKRQLLFTGQRRGAVNIWTKSISPDGKWYLQLVKRLDHVDRGRKDGANFEDGITQVLPLVDKVFTGDEGGRVFEWNLTPRHNRTGAWRR